MPDVATTQVQTRTEAICRAILDELRRRRSLIDASPDLVAVTISVKLQDTPDPIRSVVYEDQSVRGKKR